MSLTKVIILVSVFSLTWLFPSAIDGRKFVSLSRQVSIKTNKNYPPHIAFEAVTNKTQPVLIKTAEKNQNVIHLSTENYISENEDPRPNVRKMVVHPITITKSKEVIYQAKNDFQDNEYNQPAQNLAAQIDNTWMQNLKPYMRQRLAQANLTSEDKQEESSMAQAGAVVSGGIVTKSKSIVDTAIKWIGSAENTKKLNTGQPYRKSTVSNESLAYDELPSTENKSIEKEASKTTKKYTSTNNGHIVVGLIEINDGLAVTNEHHIEVRRYEEGTFQEKGTVNLIQGTYQLDLQNPKGYILARLVTSGGKILGEGIGRVSDVKWNKLAPHLGPKINITKKVDIKGRSVSAYSEGKSSPLPQSSKGKAGVFKGYVSHELDKTGKIAFDNVVSNSSSNLVVQVNGHMTTQQVIVSSNEFENVIYPQKMIEALKSVVSEQKQINLNDPNLSVIMGQVVFDKKSVSGIKVQLENYPEIEPIYFNALMLPDNKLTTTSENGYFAFIGAPDDMHHVVALRGENYFGHINTKVNAGIVSYAKIESTIKTEQTEIKVYDAFAGTPKAAELTLQSLTEKTEIDQNGFQTVFMPSVERWSLLHALPDSQYQSAYYSYTDKTDYIYVPLISKNWLYSLVTELKINIYPSSGIIMGFVHDEDFSVEIPNYENLKQNIIYFDYAGRIVKQKSGSQGGGFILFNLPTDIYEVLVIGSKSQKIYSRIAPIKPQDLYVFNFKLDN